MKKENFFSEEEINNLNQQSKQKELEDFFFNCLIKNGEKTKEARKTAQNWAYEIKKNPL